MKLKIDYDRDLINAKSRVTKLFCTPNVDPIDMAGAVEDLNKSWDNLTDCLVRQRVVRDRVIQDLMGQLAETER